MAKYSPAEVEFFRHADSPYATAEHDNFDKYPLFVERAIGLTKRPGRIGMIIPHKFMTIRSGRALRRIIANNRLLSETVHFGAKQAFGKDAANYTCVVVLDRSNPDEVRVERPGRLEAWRYGEAGPVDLVPAGRFSELPWQFADADTGSLFNRIRSRFRDRWAPWRIFSSACRPAPITFTSSRPSTKTTQHARLDGTVAIGPSNVKSCVRAYVTCLYVLSRGHGKIRG